MTQKNKKLTQKTNSHDVQPGKKGGLSVTPEIIGAMTGAAIGGLTGMMLGNKKTREKLAVVKDQVINSAEDVLQNIEVKSDGVAGNAKEMANALPEKVKNKTHKKS